MTRFLLVLATAITLSSPPAMANFAPEDDLYLVCGGYLVHVSTSWREDLENKLAFNGYSSQILGDVVPLFAGRKASYPQAETLGSAREKTISIPGWMLDRIEGTLVRITKSRSSTTITPVPPQSSAFDHVLSQMQRSSAMETSREVVAACRSSSKAEQRQIVDIHNRKVMESKPERKF